MKTKKYLLAGALVLSLSTPVMAQDVNFKNLLTPIEQALKADPNNAEAGKDLIKNYKKTSKKDPKALVALGNIFAMNKKYAEAEEMANLAIAKNKNFGDAYILLGDIQVMKDNGGDAASWYQQAMIMDPKNPQGYMSYSRIYQKVDPEESAKALLKLQEVRPDFPINAETANTFYTGQKYDKAVEYFNKCDINTLSEYYLFEYAVSAYMNNNKDKSFEVAQFGINKYPSDISFYRVSMWDAVDLQKYDEALKNAKLVIENDTVKKSARDYTYYGLALKGATQYDAAVEAFKKAFELNNKDFKPYQYISEVYTAAGKEDEALEWSQKYMDNSENTTPSDFAKLANIYIQKVKKNDHKQANFDKAIAIYENMAKKWPSLQNWAYLQAGIQGTSCGFDDKGAEYLLKIINNLEPNKDNLSADDKGTLISALQNIGYYYWGTKNNLEEAKPYYQKLLELSPDDKNAKAALGIE